MPYSRSDLIAAFRADNPDAAHIDDNHIFAAIAVEDPELAKGVSEATGSGNTLLDSRREASKQEFEQNRSLANTAMAGLHSMGQGITDAARGIVQAPLDIAHTMAQGRGVSAFDIASGAYHGVVDPVTNYYHAVQQGDTNAAAYAGGQGLVNTVPAVYGAAEGANALYKQAFPALNPTPGASAADAVVQKLAPKSAEARAQAGAVAQEAADRNSVSDVNNQGLRDARIYQRVANSKAELQAAKASVKPMAINGQPLLAALDGAIDDYSVKTPPHLKWGAQTRTAVGNPYTPLQGVVDPETLFSQRAKALTDVRNRVAKLMNDKGQISSTDLQQMKEIIDKEIADHGGWKESPTSAADRANLAALREGNGYLRDTLRNLGNDRLNAANDAFSHDSTLAKIVDSRRPEVAALDDADKAERVVAIAARERRAAQLAAAKQIAKIGAGAAVAGTGFAYGPKILGAIGGH